MERENNLLIYKPNILYFKTLLMVDVIFKERSLKMTTIGGRNMWEGTLFLL